MTEDSMTGHAALMESFGNPFRYYVTEEGAYIGSTDGEPLSANEVSPAPEYADQVWLFPGWGPSPSQLASIENAWREEQMTRVANQLLMIEDEDPDAEPGTARQWRDYRIELRKWNEVSPDFPDSSKRPVAPT